MSTTVQQNCKKTTTFNSRFAATRQYLKTPYYTLPSSVSPWNRGCWSLNTFALQNFRRADTFNSFGTVREDGRAGGEGGYSWDRPDSCLQT